VLYTMRFSSPFFPYMIMDMRLLQVILYNVRSIHNVGSVFRTADAVGVERIFIAGITPSPVDRLGKFRPEFAKVALGAERTVLWNASARTLRATLRLIQQLQKSGYTVCAVEQSKHAIPYHTIGAIQRKKKAAIVLGSETKGLPPSILKAVDSIVEIPMSGAMVRHAHHPRHARGKKWIRPARHKESLNVSVAAGIVLFRLRYP
jgi:23S rRNA (guanosine2251-2'-O)-methyltransferase